MYFSVHEADNLAEPLTTVRWRDDGSEVIILYIVADTGLPAGFPEKSAAQIPK